MQRSSLSATGFVPQSFCIQKGVKLLFGQEGFLVTITSGDDMCMSRASKLDLEIKMEEERQVPNAIR